MKIGVLVKRVPDTEFKMKLSGSGDAVDTSSAKFILNPYDEFGVEEALQLKKAKGGEVVVISFGPKKAEEAMRNALAMGADRGIRIDDAGFEDSDVSGVSHVLAAAIKGEAFDIIFAGKQAIDYQEVQVPQIVAEVLDWPQAVAVTGFEISDDATSATVTRPVGGGAVEVIELSLPAVVSADKGLNNPRYASLPNIMKAKRKKIAVMSPGDLGVDTSILGAGGARVKVTSFSMPPERQAGRIIAGSDLRDSAAQLAKALHEEAKVI